jgi:exodeoxyribonuclease VII small subunit
MPEPDPATGDEPIPYAEATAELEQILVDLERDDLDVDVLAQRVRRAALLISACRARIESVTIDVQRVVADLSSPD